MAAVATHRALTSDQIAHLLWGHAKASTRCRLRLRLLVDHGYLERAEQPVTLAEGRRPLVYFLDAAGLEVAATELGIAPGEIDWKPSYNSVKWLFLDHLLSTNQVRVGIEYAAPRTGLTITSWLDDRELSRFKDQVAIAGEGGATKTVTVGPDGYLALTAPDGATIHRAFIEADRGTVPLTRWAEKVKAYLAYFRSPAYRERYHARKPCRVLTVTTTPERMAHMKAVTEGAGGKLLFWFTTYSAIAQPDSILFAPVWHMAGHGEPVCFPYPLPSA